MSSFRPIESSASPTASSTASLAVTMLGGFEIQCGAERQTSVLPTRRADALFAKLLLDRGHTTFQRDTLATMIWPDVSPQDARHSLRVALAPIRTLVERRPEERGQRLITTTTTVRLVPAEDWWVDVWAVDERLDAARRLDPGSEEWYDALEGAAASYGGRLLPDLEEEWCDGERLRLEQRMLEAVHALFEDSVRREQYDRAIRWGRRALEICPTDEESHRALISLYLQRGQLAQALRQYHECARILQEALGFEPDEETQALEREIQARGAQSRVVSATDAPPFAVSLPASLGPGGPLVGRDRELALLQAAWQHARHGQGAFFLISGEPGIGKSRLCQALLQEVSRTGGLALSAPASLGDRQSPYQPLIDAIRHARHLAARFGLQASIPLWLEEFAPPLETDSFLAAGQGAEPSGPSLARELVGAVPTAGGADRGRLRFETTGQAPRLLDFESQSGSVDGLSRFFLSLARQRPLCLFLDDLQWADADTGRLLLALASRAPEERLLILASYREGEVDEAPWLAAWLTEVEGQRVAKRIPLMRFTEAECLQLLTLLARGAAPDALLRRIAHRLHRDTEGNPLILLESLRQWFDVGILEMTREGRWTGAPERIAAVRLPPPQRVQKLMHDRIARLPPSDRELLECAAVIGRHFTYETLQRAAARPASETLDGLRRLLAAVLIVAPPDSAAFDFQHGKLREVVSREIPVDRRRDWHRRVGEALEVEYGAGAIPRTDPQADVPWFRHVPGTRAQARAEEGAAELARHFMACAGFTARATRRASSAEPEVGRAPGTPARSVGRERPEDPERETACAEKAAFYACVAGRRARALLAYDKAVDHLEAARSLLESHPAVRQRLALMGEVVEQLAPSYRGMGRLEEARTACEEYIHLCEVEGYPLGVARGCVLLANLLYLNPSLMRGSTSSSIYERAIAVCERHGLAAWAVFPRSQLADQLAEEGNELSRVETLLAACYPEAETRRDPILWQRLYTTRLWVATWRRDWEAFREVVEASFAWGGPQHHPLFKMLSAIEERMYQEETPETFEALCGALAAGYRRAALDPPAEYWHLVPATPEPVPGRPHLRETFQDEAWHPRLTWLDPTGTSRLLRTTRPGWLEIQPAPHANLWPEADLKAPRLLAPFPDGGIAEVRVELAWETHVFAGLLLWQDDLNFVRFEIRQRRWESGALHLEVNRAGRFRLVGRGRWGQEPVWLRMERQGDEVKALCSANRKAWWSCGSVRLSPARAEQIGLVAIADGPGAHAWFETLRIWKR
jgi:predicted ATPase/DNA-binding SARP family transcriptional activator